MRKNKAKADNIPSDVSTYNGVNLKKLVSGFVILIVLAGIMIFSGAMDSNSSTSPITADNAKANVEKRGLSVDEFNDKVGRQLDSEAQLAKKNKEQEKPKQEEVMAKYKELLANKPATLAGLPPIQDADPFAEAKKAFELEEYKRALNSRKSTLLSTNAVATGDQSVATRQQNDLAMIDAKKQEAVNRGGQSQGALNTFQGNGSFTPNQQGSFAPNGGQFTPNGGAFSPNGGNASGGGAGGNQVVVDASTGIVSFPNGFAGSNATHFVNPPLNAKKIIAGTVIPIIFQSNANSDNPAQVIARVRQDVYDIDRTSIVIPAGSTVLSNLVRISSKNQAINHRNGIVGSYIIRPDGLKIDLSDLEMVDSDGTGNIEGRVNRHLLPKILASVGYVVATATSLDYLANQFSVGGSSETNTGDEIVCSTVTTTTTNGSDDDIVTTTEECKPRSAFGGGAGVVVSNTNDNDTQDIREVVVDRLSDRFEDVFRTIFEPYFSLENTIYTEAGQQANLIITKDIYADEWSNAYAKYTE